MKIDTQSPTWKVIEDYCNERIKGSFEQFMLDGDKSATEIRARILALKDVLKLPDEADDFAEHGVDPYE